MANSQLINNEYQVPENIIKYIHSVLVANPTGDGVKRAKFIVNNGKLTYQALKRIKHDLENANDSIQYELGGGKHMLGFINSLLARERAGTDISNNVKRETNIDVNLGTNAQQNPRMDINDLKI